MTKENYLRLKQNLKDLKSEIKEQKKHRKITQRTLSNYEYRVGHYERLEGRPSDQDAWWELWRPMCKAETRLLEMKANYRAMHILYSLEKGRTMQEIEQTKDDYWKEVVYSSKLPQYVKNYDFDKIDSLPRATKMSLGYMNMNGQLMMFTNDEMSRYKRLGLPYTGKLYRIEGVEL